MQRLWLNHVLILFLVISAVPMRLAAQSRLPIPPGVRAADHAQDQADQNVDAPLGPVPQKITASQVLQQSDELLSLAQQVHADTRQVAQGLLPKDLKDKLKQMEKLSKRLREELTP